jgi:hypothetical protein
MSDNRKQQPDREAGKERGRTADESPVHEVGRATREAAGRAGAALERGAASSASVTRQAVPNAREGASRTEEWTERGADEMEETGETLAETGKVGRDVLLGGAHAAAGVSGPLADAGYDGGRQLLGSAVRVFDVYREAGERSADHVRALFESWLLLGLGVQQCQHAALELADRAVGQARHKPQDLLRATSLEQLAEVQRDLYLDAIHYAIDASARLLELAKNGAQDAIRPLQFAAGGARTRQAQ